MLAVGVPVAPAGQEKVVFVIAAMLSLMASLLEQVGSSVVGVPVVPAGQVYVVELVAATGVVLLVVHGVLADVGVPLLPVGHV